MVILHGYVNVYQRVNHPEMGISSNIHAPTASGTPSEERSIQHIPLFNK